MNEKNITFIAEIGLNHNGNFGLFFELIKQASFAGADFAKFQLGWRDKEDEINRRYPETWWKDGNKELLIHKVAKHQR